MISNLGWVFNPTQQSFYLCLIGFFSHFPQCHFLKLLKSFISSEPADAHRDALASQVPKRSRSVALWSPPPLLVPSGWQPRSFQTVLLPCCLIVGLESPFWFHVTACPSALPLHEPAGWDLTADALSSSRLAWRTTTRLCFWLLCFFLSLWDESESMQFSPDHLKQKWRHFLQNKRDLTCSPGTLDHDSLTDDGIVVCST